MFYDAVANTHGLPHDPFKALVAPRPIGWISTLSRDGMRNLAPYSFFNAVSSRPNIVMFSSMDWKDSVTNARDTGEFVCSLATYDLREAMNISSIGVPADQDEFVLSGLTPAPSQLVAPPRVAESPASLECKVLSVQELQDVNGHSANHWMVLGQVVGIYISDDALTDGLFDIAKVRPLARCGYMDYADVTAPFQMRRPSLE